MPSFKKTNEQTPIQRVKKMQKPDPKASCATDTARNFFHTVEQVSNIVQYSPRQIRRWILSGDLPAYRFGRTWRIYDADLREFIERHRM